LSYERWRPIVYGTSGVLAHYQWGGTRDPLPPGWWLGYSWGVGQRGVAPGGRGTSKALSR